MAFLIYDFRELEERASKHLRVWKIWHVILYILAIIFGLLNYILLFQTEQLVTSDNHRCIFHPRELAFHWVKLPNTNETTEIIDTRIYSNDPNVEHTTKQNDAQKNVPNTTPSDEKKDGIDVPNRDEGKATTPDTSTEKDKREKREVPEEYTTTNENIIEEESNGVMLIENTTHRYMLDPSRTLFPKFDDSDCGFAQYMPLFSAMFAIVWTTLFLMCPNGGRSRSSIREPWRILTPAFVFSFVMVILTGYSFTTTNGGVEAFCAAFQNYTNTTTCSAVEPFVVLPGNTTWGIGGRIAATRAASAGVWATWTCVCALLLARCIAGADFLVKRTAVHLVRDPQNKVTPYLQGQKSPRRSQRSSQNSPSKRGDNASVKSEPTVTTELVTAMVENEGRSREDSQPTSLAITPIKEPRERRGEELEMTYTPRESFREL